MIPLGVNNMGAFKLSKLIRSRVSQPLEQNISISMKNPFYPRITNPYPLISITLRAL